MTGHVGEVVALGQLRLHVGQHHAHHLVAARQLTAQAEDLAVHLGQQIGILIGLTPHHDPVHMLQVLQGLLQAGHPPVEGYGQVSIILLDPIDARVVERRDLAVLTRAQAAQPGFAGMDDEGLAAGVAHLLDEGL
ncbi:hypothetical protein D3C78_1285530 [compost metagenome]